MILLIVNLPTGGAACGGTDVSILGVTNLAWLFPLSLRRVGGNMAVHRFRCSAACTGGADRQTDRSARVVLSALLKHAEKRGVNRQAEAAEHKFPLSL